MGRVRSKSRDRSGADGGGSNGKAGRQPQQEGTISQNPDFYKYTAPAQFSVNNDLEDIYTSWDNIVKEEDWPILKSFVLDCVKENVSTSRELEMAFVRLRRKEHRMFKKNHVGFVMRNLEEQGEIVADHPMKQLLVKKANKSTSGVLVVTVLTSPCPTPAVLWLRGSNEV